MLSAPADIQIGELELDDPELEDLAVGKSVKVLLQDMDLLRWKDDLLSDRENLERILAAARQVTPERDEKLSDLKELIADKIYHPCNENNRKLVIFSAFADTANYLYTNLIPFLDSFGLTAAVVTGSGDNKTTLKIPPALRGRVKISDLNTVLTLFSPRSKDKNKILPDVPGEIDVLIATDCISEGQNLQDCDYDVS